MLQASGARARALPHVCGALPAASAVLRPTPRACTAPLARRRQEFGDRVCVGQRWKAVEALWALLGA